MFFTNINYIVIIIATVLGMAVGFIWYAPWAFGNLWLKAKGITAESEAGKKQRPMWQTYIGLALGTVATSLVLSVMFNSLMVIGFWGIIMVGFLVWLGFMLPVKLNDYLFGRESLIAFAVTAGHLLVATLVMAFIIGIFS